MSFVTKLSKIISLLLRHNASTYGLELSSDGWVPLEKLITVIKTSSSDFANLQEFHIHDMINKSKKKRHEIKDGQIRAIYGHSNDSQLNPRYVPEAPPRFLYHGTSSNMASLICSEGLKPMDRLYVHLTSAIELAIESSSRKTSSPTVLRIDTESATSEGINFYNPEGTIWLAKYIPPKFIQLIHQNEA